MTKEKTDRQRGFQRLMGAFLCALTVVAFLAYHSQNHGEDTKRIKAMAKAAIEKESEELEEGEQTEDVETAEDSKMPEETVTEVKKLTFGIDVSMFQGEIDWAQVAEAGIDFVMVRIGYRKSATGEIMEDECARYNLQQAAANGIYLGAYFFSTAVNEDEVREEADWVCAFLKDYPITYPVVYNCEGFQRKSSRQYGMSVEERTKLAQIFLDQIEDTGYTGMFYAAKGELQDNLCWDTDRLEERYRIWVAQYFDKVSVALARPEYNGEYAMWQYTDEGSVQGIQTVVDLNVAYFGYN